MGGYARGQKQNNSQVQRLFRWTSPWFVLRRQYCGIAAHLWVVQMEVDMFFFFLVFWSFGFRVGFHAPLLVARMGGVSLSLHVLRVS